LLPKSIAVFTARQILAAKASWSYPEYSITKRLFPTLLSLKFLLTETGITANDQAIIIYTTDILGNRYVRLDSRKIL